MDRTARMVLRLMVAVFAVVLLAGGCSDDGTDAGSNGDATTDEQATDEPSDDDASDDGTTTTEAAEIPDEDLSQTDFAQLMMSGDEVAGYFDAATAFPLVEQEPFDLAGDAHYPCNYPPEGVEMVAGEGQEHRNDGSVSVTQYIGAYSADDIDDSWTALQDAADLEGKCVDFELDGETNDVSGTESIRQVFQAQHGLDVNEDDNLLVTQFETPKGTKIMDVVVRSGQHVGQFRVVYTSAATDLEAVEAGAAFVEQYRQALEG